MITHVVAFRWTAGLAAEDIEQMQALLQEFAATLPEVRSYRCGSDVGASEMNNFDFGIVAEFDNVDDWRVYDKHPRHQEIRAVSRPWIAERASVQFEK
jgi:hypothetical protein